MPLNPDKLREASEKADSLSKRFDAFLERRKADADAEDEDDDDDEECFDPSAELPPSEKRPCTGTASHARNWAREACPKLMNKEAQPCHMQMQQN
jgi:hypothetical protein